MNIKWIIIVAVAVGAAWFIWGDRALLGLVALFLGRGKKPEPNDEHEEIANHHISNVEGLMTEGKQSEKKVEDIANKPVEPTNESTSEMLDSLKRPRSSK